MRYIGKKIIGAFDNQGYYLQKSAIGLIPKREDVDLKFILAILNSKLINWYYLKLMGENIYPRINLNYVLKFPIKNVDNKTKTEIIKLVDKIINEKDKKNLIKELDEKICEIYGVSEKDLK